MGKTGIVVLLLLLLAGTQPSRADAAGPPLMEIPGVVHVHTDASSGAHSLEALTAMAAASGLSVLALADHDWVALQYGVAPFENILRYKKTLPSVLSLGAEKVLARVAEANSRQKDVLVIPGVQCSPYYYWTGSPLRGDLTAHDYRKELLVLGMEKPGDYEALPRMHGPWRLPWNPGHNIQGGLMFLLSLAMAGTGGVWLRRRRSAGRGRRKRLKDRAPGLLLVCGLLLAMNNHPFGGSPYNPFQGNLGEAPFQHFINTARARGGLVFWAHPEARYSETPKPIGPIFEQTRPYAASLLTTTGATGFGALYGDTALAVLPGREWDLALLEYCQGRREEAPVAIADADYHADGDGVALDTFQTVFLASEPARAAVLDALREGRVYAVRKEGGFALRLRKFRVTPEEGRAEPGAEKIPWRVDALLCASDGGGYSVTAEIVADGRAAGVFSGKTPFEFSATVEAPPGKSFIRLLATGPGAHRLVSNPVFPGRAASDRPGGGWEVREAPGVREARP
jgi:hypothetical protein